MLNSIRHIELYTKTGFYNTNFVKSDNSEKHSQSTVKQESCEQNKYSYNIWSLNFNSNIMLKNSQVLNEYYKMQTPKLYI